MWSRRPVLNVEARRMMPWTSYPFESRNSTRYDPSWPVTPVMSALGMRVSPGARSGPLLRGHENVSRNGGEFNDGPGRAAFRISADRHIEPAGGLPGGGGTAVRGAPAERIVAGHVRGPAGETERPVPRRRDGGAGARSHPPHGRGAREGGGVERAAVFGGGSGRLPVRARDARHEGPGGRPLVRRAARSESGDLAEETVPRGQRGRGSGRRRGGGIFRAEPAVPDRRGVRDERGRRRRARCLWGGRKVLPSQHVGEGSRVDEALRGGEGGARQPSIGEGRPGAAGPGDGAGGGAPGAGAADRAGPGYAAGAAREGVSRPRRRRPA